MELDIIVAILVSLLIIGIGIFAIFKIRRSSKSPENNLIVGIGLGMMLGIIIGLAMKNISLGISLGAGAGIAIGSAIPAKDKENSKKIAVIGLISLLVAIVIIVGIVIINGRV